MNFRRALLGFFSLLASVSAPKAFASVCCGGHAAIPAMITGYETRRLNASFSEAQQIGIAPEQGRPIFYDQENQTTSGTWRFSGAALQGESWQFGAGVGASTKGNLADSDLMVGYKAFKRPGITSRLPDIIIFSQLTLPTGRSFNEVTNTRTEETTGSGHYHLSTGTLALTTYRKWDGFTIVKAGWSVPRTFSRPGGDLIARPGWNGDVSLGGGYALTGSWRLGAMLQAAVTEAKATVEKDRESYSAPKMVWPVTAQVTYFHDMNSTLSLNYQDETLVGPVRNSTLARSVAFQYSYRWSNDE